MRIAIDHTTHYRYERPVRYSTQYLRLLPKSSPRQKVLEWQLITPAQPLQLSDVEEICARIRSAGERPARER